MLGRALWLAEAKKIEKILNGTLDVETRIRLEARHDGYIQAARKEKEE